MLPRLDMPARVALLYLLVASAWILFSDRVLELLVEGESTLTRAQSYKGVAFVVFTAGMLLLVLRDEERRRIQVERARQLDRERVRSIAEQVQDVVFRYRLWPEPGLEFVNPAIERITGHSRADHLADPGLAARLVHPDDHSYFALALDQLDGVAWRVVRADGTVVWAEQRSVVEHDAAGNAIAVEGIFRDVTEAKRAEAALERALDDEQEARRSAEATADRLARLQSATAALGAALTFDHVLEVILDEGMRSTGAHGAMVFLMTQDGDALHIVGSRGLAADPLNEFEVVPLDSPLPLAVAARSGEPLWVDDREPVTPDSPGLDAREARLDDRAQVSLPLISSGHRIGVLHLGFEKPRIFDSHDRALLTTIAQQCALALERALLYEAVQGSQQRLHVLSQRLIGAEEGERRRIARELHDELGQLISGLKMNLHGLRLRGDHEGSDARLQESLALVDRILQHIRTLSRELRPTVLDDVGLAEALTWLCNNVAERSGIEVRVEEDLAQEPLPDLIATTCFRIAQEALNNAARHSGARHLRVSLRPDDHWIELIVEDDGDGFDVAGTRARAKAGSSLGLINMVERAELVGGSTTIHSERGVGTKVLVRLPVDPDAAVLSGG